MPKFALTISISITYTAMPEPGAWVAGSHSERRPYYGAYHRKKMPIDSNTTIKNDWRAELPPLAGRVVSLREPVARDLGPLVDLLSIADASRFGIEDTLSEAV